MTSLPQLLTELEQLGVKLSLNGERLRCDAPKGVLTPALQAELSKHKAEIIARLQQSAPNSGHAAPPPNEPAPLSFGQRRLWFLDQLEGPNAAYNLPGAVHLTGALDIAVLTHALQAIVHRHAILRTTFRPIAGEPVQIVQEKTLQLQVIDVVYATVEEREAKIEQLVQAEAHCPFDLTQDLMLRASLLRLIPQSSTSPASQTFTAAAGVPEYVLQVTMHHIASDAWSRRIFHDELSALYRAFLEGRPSPLSPLPMQYTDFVQWQQQWLSGATLAKQLNYWKAHLSGVLPVLTLPQDYPRPAQLTFIGHKCIHPLPSTLVEALKQVSRRHQVTLFMTMLAAFKILLMRLSGQEDIIIGTPVTRRNRTELEGVIGFFINTVVLRTDLAGNPTFDDLLTRVKRTTLDGYANQDVPFEKLVEELQPERVINRNPLFQVWFNMFPGPEPIQLPGVTSVEVPPSTPPSMFDLIIYIQDADPVAQTGLEVSTVYNAKLFSAARMQELLAQFQTLLEQIVTNPAAPIATYSLVPSATRALLPDPRLPLPRTWAGAVQAQFAAQAVHAPQQMAVVGNQCCFRYGELDALSNQLAHYLLAHGITGHDVVAVYTERSPILVLALLGVLKAGAAFSLLDAAYPAPRLLAYCEQARPVFLLHLEAAGALPTDLAARFAANCCLLANAPTTLQSMLQGYPSTAPTVVVTPEQRMYIAFTSGSTGNPKAIVGTHCPVAHFVTWQRQTFGFTHTDRFSLLSGLAHDPLLRDIFTPLALGATLCVPEATMLASLTLAAWMEEQAITVAHLTPQMGQLLAVGPAPVNTILRYLFFGGDQLTHQQLKRMVAFASQATCVNFYGATETPQAMGYAILDPSTEHATIPLGRGIDGVQLLVINQTGQLAGIGEIGEIVVRTPYLTEGYWEDAALTQQRFIPNPWRQDADAWADRLYKTGDLGRYLPDGQVTFVSRADGQVKIRGFRLEPSEIERVLLQHPSVQAALVTPYVDAGGHQQLVAYIVPRQQSIDPRLEDELPSSDLRTVAPSPQALRAYLQAKLPSYMVPAAFVPLPNIPLTPTGKIDRRALPAPDLTGIRPSAVLVAPRTLVEMQLTALWETVLRRHPLGIRDNFFELGGHSLLAVQLLIKVQQQFGKMPALATFLQSPTVEHMAALLQLQDDDQPTISFPTPLVALQKQGVKAPFFCVHGADGYIYRFYSLARALGLEQPFYGLQAVDINGEALPLLTIPALATHYRETLQTVQPHGPYHLGGYSFGAKVAYEMARQLVENGEIVESLVIIDGAAPRVQPQGSVTPPMVELDDAELLLYIVQQTTQWYGKALTLSVHALQGLGFSEQIQVVNTWLAAAQLPVLQPNNRQWINNFQIYKRNIQMSYTPSTTIPVRTALFYTQERFDQEYAIHQEPALGWSRWLNDPITCTCIPGNHVTLLAEPHVQVLAQQLVEWLR